MLIGLISDTHIPGRRKNFPHDVFGVFKDVDLILHAGDIVSQEILDLLGTIAPVTAVAGNNDPPELADRLGTERILQLGGYTVGLTHGHLGKAKTTADRAYEAFSGVDVIVFGHSHRPLIEQRGTTLLVNPGSPTDRLRNHLYTVALLELGEMPRATLVGLRKKEKP